MSIVPITQTTGKDSLPNLRIVYPNVVPSVTDTPA